MSGTVVDYAGQVAADVAARYGCAVAPAVVQVVPRGVSAMSLPVWDGQSLIYPDGQQQYRRAHAALWANKRAAARRGVGLSPEVTARRAEVALLHGQGLGAGEMALRLSVSVEVIRNDHKVVGLDLVAGGPRGHSPAVAVRLALMRRLADEGLACDRIADALAAADGRRFSPDAVQKMARRILGLSVPLREVSLRGGYVRHAVADRRRQVSDLIACGVAVPEICERLAVPMAHLLRDLVALGCQHLIPAPRGKVLPPSADYGAISTRRAEVRVMHSQGVTVLSMAKRFVVDAKTIYRDLAAMSLPAPGWTGVDVRPAGAGNRRGAAPAVVAARDARRLLLPGLVAEGLTAVQIAQRFGLQRNAINRDLRDMGLTDQVARKPGHRVGAGAEARDARRKAVARMHGEGLSYRVIAKRLGVARSTIFGDLRAMAAVGDAGMQNDLDAGPSGVVVLGECA